MTEEERLTLLADRLNHHLPPTLVAGWGIHPHTHRPALSISAAPSQQSYTITQEQWDVAMEIVREVMAAGLGDDLGYEFSGRAWGFSEDEAPEDQYTAKEKDVMEEIELLEKGL